MPLLALNESHVEGICDPSPHSPSPDAPWGGEEVVNIRFQTTALQKGKGTIFLLTKASRRTLLDTPPPQWCRLRKGHRGKVTLRK